MRALAIAWGLFLLSGCTCQGCGRTAQLPEPDAGPVAAVVEVDAGEGAASLEADLDQDPLSPDALLALYASDCHARVEVTPDDGYGPPKVLDCDLLAFDQNCGPDSFRCWESYEQCRVACGEPCKQCQERCGDACDACRQSCDGGDCTTDCASGRVECRSSCMDQVQACRDACMNTLDDCEAEGKIRRAELCPDCERIQECLNTTQGEAARAECVPENNAAECREWCYWPI